MKSYKARALKAIKIIAVRYKDPDYSFWQYFTMTNCELCKIYYNGGYTKTSCVGCPLAIKGRTYGCTKFKTYKAAHRAVKSFSRSDQSLRDKSDMQIALNRRADFLLDSISELKKYPAKQFTPSGFKPFKLFNNRENQ